MEWLRSIDLSEYAPNLRGSGVHGALMVRTVCLNVVKTVAVCKCEETETLLLGTGYLLSQNSPGSRLPLLSARPAFTFPAEEHNCPETAEK